MPEQVMSFLMSSQGAKKTAPPPKVVSDDKLESLWDFISSSGGVTAYSIALLRAINEGLPLKLLDELVLHVSPQHTSFKYLIVPKPTLDRRRKSKEQRLSADESAKVARLASVMRLAQEVWGDEDVARDFMFRPHALLEMQKPVDVVLMNEFGADLVKSVLLRLRHGTAA